MCGRYATTMGQMSLYGLFAAEDESAEEVAGMATDIGPASEKGVMPADLAANRFNIAPTSVVPVAFGRLLGSGSEGAAGTDAEPAARSETEMGQRAVRRIAAMKWGLVPSWAKDLAIGNRMINARAESIMTKPVFRKSLANRRCLVPASGYFEWRKASSAGSGRSPDKQPFYVTPQDGSAMAFAGLWDFWKTPQGLWLRSMTIVTTAAVGELTEIHDRMPLILPASEWDEWLDPAAGAEQVEPLLGPSSEELVAQLELRPISLRVGNVKNDDPGLLERVQINQRPQSTPSAHSPY